MKLCDYDAFVFDLDGTLIDSGKYHSQAFADAVFAQSGYPLTSSEHHEFFASHSSRFAHVLNERHGLQLIPEKVLEYKRKRVQEIFVAELFTGAQQFLDRWVEKKPLALATNSPLSFVQPALEAAEIFRYFNCVITADDVVHRKPDPEIIEVCLRKLGVGAAKTLVFEERYF